MPFAILGLVVLGGPTEAPIPEPPAIAEFKRRDLDNDGMLSREEYVKPSLGSQWEQPAQQESVLYDLDGDGMLSPVEFGRTPAGSADAATMFDLLDANEDRVLDLQEFANRHPPGYEDAVKLEFAHFDADGSGQVDREEFLTRGKVVAGEFVKQFSGRDEDGDGRISREEYVRPNIGTQWEAAAKQEAVFYDLDADGFLTAAEYALTPPATSSRAMRFALADRNQNGSLDRTELLNVHADVDVPVVGAWFLRYDRNGDRAISAAEWNREGWESDPVFDPVVAQVEKGVAA
ncbi:MAG: EF-hand domain-containing protein, partial [Planctomycetota bacterium]|nr:EF-hand domain-containing protein [Planctomycetota bacterium]